ncbi:hypothetical protein C7271_12940 [filamentous cyanobacterium CCP5]|nr:hypothetical protein C7271_12940 [filamentous cyanobacterium CCP5]
MLEQLVRPLVRTQIEVLAKAPSAAGRLTSMISQWLGYLGVRAEVKQLRTADGKIHVSMVVDRPEQCREQEWQKILTNIRQNHRSEEESFELTYARMSEPQRSKVHRLLAHVIQAGSSENPLDSWPQLQTHLADMGMNEMLLAGIKAGLKQPASLDALLKNLDPEVAAFVLSRGIAIALLDRQINQDEDDALKALYSVLEQRSA